MESGTPSLEELSRRRIEWVVPTIDEIASGPVDAVIAPGMGPVQPQLRGIPNESGVRRPAATFDRMRVIAVAAHELVRQGYVASDGVIIPTGRATAKPASPAEAEAVAQTAESALMRYLVERIPKEQSRAVLEEHEAKNTIENIIRIFNLLDKRAGGVWRGTLAVVTSNFGQIGRIVDLFHAFGIENKNIVPLSAEQALRHSQYGVGFSDAYQGKVAAYDTLTEAWLTRNTLQLRSV